jgi:hypothetical protein
VSTDRPYLVLGKKKAFWSHGRAKNGAKKRQGHSPKGMGRICTGGTRQGGIDNDVFGVEGRRIVWRQSGAACTSEGGGMRDWMWMWREEDLCLSALNQRRRPSNVVAKPFRRWGDGIDWFWGSWMGKIASTRVASGEKGGWKRCRHRQSLLPFPLYKTAKHSPPEGTTSPPNPQGSRVPSLLIGWLLSRRQCGE